MKMVSGSFYIPKEKNGMSKPQGDDAHFISEAKQTIGVADGVGGWADKGIDAGEYARRLMNNCVIAIQDEPAGAVEPIRVLNKAYSNTLVQGSSTACILTLIGNVLHVANVGDSGFILISEGAVLYHSPVQQHSFNYPYQLGINSDPPHTAQVFKVVVKPGDVLVTGTDGLFDNMFEHEIKMIVDMGIEEGIEEPQRLAWAIAETAYHRSLDKNSTTPFMVAYNSSKGGSAYCGGKKDDITVLVSYILDPMDID